MANEVMIPISALNALEYCPRKFYYQFVQGEAADDEWEMEEALARQRLQHEEQIQSRRLYLRSETWRLSGFAEVIEERAGVMVPIEYKREGQSVWPNEQIQLCAQALCLEERQPGVIIAAGLILYTDSRRQAAVPFTPQVRARTKAAITRALEVSALQTAPPPLSGKLVTRCAKCSHRELCLPEEVRLLQAQKHG